MIGVTVICIGKLKEKYLKDACAEYAKRLGAFCRFELIELDEQRIADSPSEAQIKEVLQAEGRRILAKIPNQAAVFSLCIEGKQLSSEELAQKITETAAYRTGNIVFIIGGSWGLSDEVKQRSDFRLSMSKMTFPHQLARVMLSEQIYRAFQISSGGKYHK